MIRTTRLISAAVVLGMAAATGLAATVDFDPTGEYANQFSPASYSESATGGLNGSVGISLTDLLPSSFDGSQSESLTVASVGDAITVGAFVNFSSFGTGQALRLGTTNGGSTTFNRMPFATLYTDSSGTAQFMERNASMTDANTFTLTTGSWYYFESTFTYDSSGDAAYDVVIANADASGKIGTVIDRWSFPSADSTSHNWFFTVGSTLYGGFKGDSAYDSTGAAVIDNLYVSANGTSQVPNADINGDGVVDAADYIILKQHMGQSTSAGAAAGDFNGNGTVDWSDLQTLLGAMRSGSSQGASVPEPATLTLLAMGAMGILRRRRS